MKKYILILLLLTGMNTLIKAQQQKTPTATEMATKSIEALDKRLKLNPTQRNVIYTYTLDLSKTQLELFKKQQTGAPMEDDISKFYKLQNETTKNIRNILKGDQQTEYDKIIEEGLNGDNGKKKSKKGKHSKKDKEVDTAEVVTGIEGLKLPPNTP